MVSPNIQSGAPSKNHYYDHTRVKGRHRALSEATFFADPKLDARPLWRGLRYTYLLHETSLAARGSQDGPAQPCQHEGGSTKDLMVITRWMSYEAALLGTAEDLKSRGASLCMQVKAFMRIPSGSASLTTCPPPCTRSYLSSHDTVDELVHKDS